MHVKSYFYIKPTNINFNSIVTIPNLDRYDYMNKQYLKLAKDYLNSIVLSGKTAVLYAGGVTVESSEGRNVTDLDRYELPQLMSGLAIRELSAHNMHKYIGQLHDKELVEYASINANTCASSMYSLYEAEKLIRHEGYEEVIIITEDKASHNTIRVFDECNIPVKVGDALAIMHLTSKERFPCITNTKWKYEWNRNPFNVTSEGYNKVIGNIGVRNIKPHGTDTYANNNAEDSVLPLGKKEIRYKKEIGHTQGSSSLLEICMLLDDDSIKENTLCLASGLGGFYGSCIVTK